MELDLETGRKNQIRVHMQDLGHPIIGDGRYGGENTPNPIGRLAGNQRTDGIRNSISTGIQETVSEKIRSGK